MARRAMSHAERPEVDGGGPATSRPREADQREAAIAEGGGVGCLRPQKPEPFSRFAAFAGVRMQLADIPIRQNP